MIKISARLAFYANIFQLKCFRNLCFRKLLEDILRALANVLAEFPQSYAQT